MKLTQQFVRVFKHRHHSYVDGKSVHEEGQSSDASTHTWITIRSFGLSGFASMHLAAWEQSLLVLGSALSVGGVGTILIVYLVVASLYGFVTKSLSDMVRDNPNSAGPFYWTAAYREPFESQSATHIMTWLCAWMNFLGAGINLIVNMLFVTDVIIFLFTLAGRSSKFIYSSEEPLQHLRLPWALPVTIIVVTTIALFVNWKGAKQLPSSGHVFHICHWAGFFLFAVAIPVLYNKIVGNTATV